MGILAVRAKPEVKSLGLVGEEYPDGAAVTFAL